MIQYLGNTLDEFPGAANQTRCFAHTVNLIAKAILKPFDARKAKDIQLFNDVAHALADLAEGHDSDAHTTGDDDKEDEEDKEGNHEDEEEDNETKSSLEPIGSMLLKVRSHFIDHNHKLRQTCCLVATQNCARSQELDDNPPASMVQDSVHSQPSIMYDATGCTNALEFHLRHA